MTGLRSLLLIVGGGLSGAALPATMLVDVLDDGLTTQACSLRTAVKAINEGQDTGGCANTAAQPYGHDDAITFAAGLSGTITLLEGQLELRAPVHLAGPGHALLTINKSNAAGHNHRIIWISHPGSSVISGLSIRDGRPLGAGGGIFSTADRLEVRDSRVFANSASYGAGIYLNSGSSLKLVRSHVSHNWADVGTDGPAPFYRVGGGILARGGQIEVIDSEIVGNVARGTRPQGAGIQVEAGSLLLEGSVVANNHAAPGIHGPARHGRGGGIHVNGDVIVNHSRISGNFAEGQNMYGGGMFVTGGCLQMQHGMVLQNMAGFGVSMGGGLHLSGDCSNVIIDSVIAGNIASGGDSNGGGIYAGSSNVALILLRSAVLDNRADALTGDGTPSHGGGIGALRPTTLINTTVAGNQVFLNSRGGGLFITRTLNLLHSTITTNSAFDVPGEDDIAFFWGEGEGYEFFAHGSLFAQEPVYNPFTLMVETGISCGVPITQGQFNLATDSSCGTSSLIGQSPVALTALQLQPSGPKGTAENPFRALGPASIAIDAAGDCIAAYTIDSDQRGLPRPGGDSLACDVGAYERQESTPADEYIFRDGFEVD